MKTSRFDAWSWAGIGSAIFVIGLGIYWAFQRGAYDFFVFHHSWTLVLVGRGREIYANSPDFYLYAPGFAWLFAPLGALPRPIALAIWCGLKATLILAAVFRISEHVPLRSRLQRLGISSWGFVLVARPFLIDLQYGQVNSMIVSVCILALTAYFSGKRDSIFDFISWTAVSLGAFVKLVSLPILMVPWLVARSGGSDRPIAERMGIIVGAGLCFLLPLTQLSASEALQLMVAWKGAILAKGFPVDSHNQSFAALLYHYLSGNVTPVIGEKQYLPLSLGWPLLDNPAVQFLSLGWACFGFAFIVSCLLLWSRRVPLFWIGVFTASLIVPAHLIWKSYFVMTFPLMVACLVLAIYDRKVLTWILPLSAVFNFSGFDFTGHYLGPRIEAASALFLVHLALLAIAMTKMRGFPPISSFVGRASSSHPEPWSSVGSSSPRPRVPQGSC